MNCKTHKTYRGIRKPTANCRKCKLIFRWRKFLKACGFPVAEVRRAPKGEATKVQEFCKEFGVAVIDRGGDENHFLPQTETPYFSSGLTNAEADAKDAATLQVAAVSLGAEKRIETFEPAWRTPEVAAQLQAYERGELTAHQRTALFLKLNDAGAFSPKEQVRNIGEGAKAE